MSNQQLKLIAEPHPNDVLSGRGNSANHHPGNAYFRNLVKTHRHDYVACPKSSKAIYAKLIYQEIQQMNPPGRFLKQDPATKKWNDIGKKASLAKIRQALREGAPEILRDMQTLQQFRNISQSEVTEALGFASSAQRSISTEVTRSYVMSETSNQQPSNAPSVVAAAGPGSGSLLSFGNSDATYQFSGRVSSHGGSTAGACITESSDSSLSVDSVTPDPAAILNSTQGQLQLNEQLEALLRLQSAFQQANAQVNQQQHFTRTFNNGSVIQHAPQSFSTPPIAHSAPMLNPQQQHCNNAVANNTVRDNPAALMSLILNGIRNNPGFSNGSNN